jgi:hypothetical protein
LSRRASCGSDLVAGALAIGLWAVVPKCPVCVAAHVALWTGVGLSFAAASYLRWSLLGLCAVMLVYAGCRMIALVKHNA